MTDGTKLRQSRVWWYIGALLLFSWACEFFLLQTFGLENAKAIPLFAILMLLPGLFAIGYLLITKEGFRTIDWGIKKPSYLLYAVIIPAALALLSMLVIGALHIGTSPHFAFTHEHISIKRGMFLLGKGEQSPWFFAVNYFVTAVVFSVINGIPAFGEELGWRGFLQPRLVSRYGIVSGIILLGLIWGFWHFPLILSGYNYPEHPVLGALVLFPLTTVFSSFLLAWLTLSSRSLWPAVLAHGCVNTFYGQVVSEMNFGVYRLTADVIILSIWFLTAVVSYMLLQTTRTHLTNR